MAPINGIELEPLLPEIKRMVNDNGLLTLQEVDVIIVIQYALVYLSI
jgi:hypothetical protein